MKIICFGDSNTWGFDPRGYFGGRYDHPWPELLAEEMGCTVINWGENGREIPGKAFDFPPDADLLVIMLGTNDLLQGASTETVSGRMERFIKPLAREKLLLVAPPPMKLGAWVSSQKLIDDSVALAKQYQTLSERLSIRFADAGDWNIPLTYDGVHMTAEGHKAFTDGLIEYLHKGE